MENKFYQRQIEKAQRKSEKAIDKFMTTEKQLQKQVGIIDTNVACIDEEIAKLKEIRTAAIQRRKENIGIIGRIREFLKGPEEGGE